MTRSGRRLIEDFLLPALNDRRYGERLQWVDESNLYFSIRWNHKNAAKWTLEDTVVFQDWDKLKGHFHPDIKGYYMQAKQRFRAALYKLNTVRKVCSQDKHVKVYQLVFGNEKRRTTDSSVLQERPKCERGIPTSVICENTNYIPQKRTFDSLVTQENDWLEQVVLVTKEYSEHSSSMSSPDSVVHSNEASSDSFVMKTVELQESPADEEMDQTHEESKPMPNHRHVRAPIMPSYSSHRRNCVAPPPTPRKWGDYFIQPHQDSKACFVQSNPVELGEDLKNQEPNADVTPFSEQTEEALNLSTKSKSYENTYIPVSAR